MPRNGNDFYKCKGQDLHRPLQSLSFMADAASSPGSASATYHVSDILAHALVVLSLLLRLLPLLGYAECAPSPLPVFAAHPLFAQAVAWIPGRGDPPLGFLGICAFVALVKFRKSGKFRHCAVSAAALVCAPLSKKNAVARPLLFAAYLLLCDRERGLHRRYLAAAVSWLAVCAAYLVLRKAAMNGLPGGGTFGFGVLIGNLRALPELLTGFFVPYDIPVMPSFTLSSTAIGSAAVLLIVIALGMQGRLRRPMVLFGRSGSSCCRSRHDVPPGTRSARLYVFKSSFVPAHGRAFHRAPQALPDFKRRGLPVFSLVAVAGGVAALCMLANRQSAFFANPVAFYDQAIRTEPGIGLCAE